MSQVTFILEGENKTGKTTLATLLRDRYGFKVVKCSQPRGDAYKEYAEKLNAASGRTVFDRMYLGELVYGKLYRGGSQLDEVKCRNLDLLAMSKNTIVIHCVDDAEKIIRRFKSEHEEFADERLVHKTLKLYDEAMGQTSLCVTKHQMRTKDDLTTHKHDLERLIDIEQRQQVNYKDIIGNLKNPTMLLVGETRNKNNNKYNDIGQPFDFGVSSKFLFDAIKRAQIPLNHLAIANSDSKSLSRFISDNPTMMVVALGKIAHEKITKLGVRCYKLNHPNYENRFHRHDSDFHMRLKKIYLS